MATPSQAGGTAVVGYFAHGHQAHRAINALIDEGFLPSEIGAAFHTGAGAAPSGGAGAGSSREETRRPNIGGELRDELGTTLPEHTTSERTRTGTSSAASDTLAVQYASLGGGAGTPYDMPPRPGPISGGDVTHSGLPSELKSELPHDSDLRGEGTQGGAAGENWGERMRPVFGNEQNRHETNVSGSGKTESGKTESGQHESGRQGGGMEAVIRKDEHNFGTGEGSLNLNTPPPQRYSQPAFERSFSNYGVQPEHARHLSHRIGGGGAVVTVHATARAEAAERILEAHGGEVRMNAQPQDYTSQGAAQDGEVEVFGTVGRDYPGYLE